jgi:hypothetical protein
MKGIRVEGELLRHEADLYDWSYAVLQQTVINLIDVSEVIDRVAVFVFVVDAEFVVEDSVETDVVLRTKELPKIGGSSMKRNKTRN